MQVIRQIKEHEVYNVVSRIHNSDDIETGDLAERIEEFEYYNHIADYPIENLDLDSFCIDEDKMDDIVYLIEENGLSSMPKIVINDNDEIIDGIHRLKALDKLGYKKIDLLKGTNEEYKQSFKKELIDESMQIYKISNNFGSISIMENAK